MKAVDIKPHMALKSIAEDRIEEARCLFCFLLLSFNDFREEWIITTAGLVEDHSRQFLSWVIHSKSGILHARRL